MTIELSMMISIVAVAFAMYQGIANLKRNQRADDKSETSQLTTVIVKLESIGLGVAEIKSEMSNIKTDMKEDRERIVKVEEAAKSLKERLDSCEKHCKRFISNSNEKEKGVD